MLAKGEGCVREEIRKIDIELFRMEGKVGVGGVEEDNGREELRLGGARTGGQTKTVLSNCKHFN